MRAAVLCPGYSLPAQYSGTLGHDLVIAVNRAVEFGSCDMWCCFDWKSFGRFDAPSDLPIICRKDVWQIGVKAGSKILNPLAMLIDPKAQDTPPDEDSRYTWSSLGAVIGAYMFGANYIQMYGADMEGTRDFTMREGSMRGDNRWRKEKSSLASLMGWMAENGVVVERVTQ